jgi:hypothetical protein
VLQAQLRQRFADAKLPLTNVMAGLDPAIHASVYLHGIFHMLNPGLPDPLWTILDGRLWHATTTDGLQSILQDGEIKPDIGRRYMNSFCRYHGAVCLFDFGPTSIDAGQFHNLHGWFGSQHDVRLMVWLEIDRERSTNHLWDAATTRALANNPPYKTFIAGVEACHKGPIPTDLIKGALLIARDSLDLFSHHKWPIDTRGAISEFVVTLPPEPANTLADKLKAARLKHTKEKGVDGRVKPGHDSEG